MGNFFKLPFESYEEWPENPDRSVLSVDLAGITHPNPKYRIMRNDPELYVLEYVESGTGHLRVMGEPFDLHAGDVYLLQPHAEHVYCADRHDPWTKIWFNLRGPLIDALCDVYALRGRYVFPAHPELRESFVRGLQLIHDRNVDLKTEFALLLHRIFAGLALPRDAERISEPGRKMRQYLLDHCHMPVTLKDLEQLTGRSAAQILRIFRADFHTTPHVYLNTLRLKRAQQFLEHTPAPIAVIAAHCGFPDPFYFANWFRRQTGYSPSAWRKAAASS